MRILGEFPLHPRWRLAAAFLYVFLIGTAIYSLIATFHQGGLGIEGIAIGWTIAVFVFIWWMQFRIPSSIHATEDNLCFRSHSGEVVVPWIALGSISVGGMVGLRWRWDGGRIDTPCGFQRLDELLAEVRRRAPQAIVRVQVSTSGRVRPPQRGR